MPNNNTIPRFIGVNSYPDDDDYNNLFFGREKEIEKIMQSVYSGGSAIDYGASGVGKTSLVNSGLLPGIRKEGKLWPVRVSLRELSRYGSLLSLIKWSITQGKHNSQVKIKFPEEPKYASNLPKWVNKIKVSRKADNTVLPIVFIFDQFESIFDLPVSFTNTQELLSKSNSEIDIQTLTVNEALMQLNILSDPSEDNQLFEEDFVYDKTLCVRIPFASVEN